MNTTNHRLYLSQNTNHSWNHKQILNKFANGYDVPTFTFNYLQQVTNVCTYAMVRAGNIQRDHIFSLPPMLNTRDRRVYIQSSTYEWMRSAHQFSSLGDHLLQSNFSTQRNNFIESLKKVWEEFDLIIWLNNIWKVWFYIIFI